MSFHTLHTFETHLGTMTQAGRKIKPITGVKLYRLVPGGKLKLDTPLEDKNYLVVSVRVSGKHSFRWT
jgi:hypothetical protein